MHSTGCAVPTKRLSRRASLPDSCLLTSQGLVIEVTQAYYEASNSNERSINMSASSIVRASGRARRRPAPLPRSRFDQRLSEILTHATDVFDEKGYAGASMRDLSRASGMSLAGLYYYFESKEKLLYLIQRHTFTTIVQRLKDRLEGVSDPEQQIRIFILNHLEYFLANPASMKVLSHEAEALRT